jgi:hypothetical protein
MVHPRHVRDDATQRHHDHDDTAISMTWFELIETDLGTHGYVTEIHLEPSRVSLHKQE